MTARMKSKNKLLNYIIFVENVTYVYDITSVLYFKKYVNKKETIYI